MTPYHFANKEKKESVSKTRIVIVTVLIVLISSVAIFGITELLKTITRGPAWLARTTEEAVLSGITQLTPKSVILERNTQLEERVLSYEASLIELQQVKNENELLRKELNYLPVKQASVLAQVIGKPNHSLFNTMVIDVGIDQGVKVGQLVTSQGVLGVGTVVSVSSKTATVELFGAPHFEGEVLLSNKGITVPATGKGSGNFEIHIPREVEVTDGDLLAFPQNPGITIGIVKSIIFDPRDPFQTVLARLPVNVQELRFVEVVQ